MWEKKKMLVINIWRPTIILITTKTATIIIRLKHSNLLWGGYKIPWTDRQAVRKAGREITGSKERSKSAVGEHVFLVYQKAKLPSVHEQGKLR